MTVAFGVRNFAHLEKGLAEIFRVLKPGGKLVVLEFSKPKIIGIQQFYNLYMGIVAPGIGSIFSKNRDAYQYLHDSVQKFPEGKAFTDILNTNRIQGKHMQKIKFRDLQYLYRHKIVVVLTASLFLFHASKAQLRESLNLSNHDEKPYYFGIVLGYNTSHYNITHHPYFLQRDTIMSVESQNSGRVTPGILVNWQASPRWDVRFYPLEPDIQ